MRDAAARMGMEGRGDEAGSAAGTVFGGILQALEARRLVPGQRLVEADLVLQFGVGRNSVREALQRLAAEGIVELFRHKGAAVRVLSAAETQDVLEVAERITGLLARSAARAVARGASAAPVREALARVEQADRAADPQAFGRARRAFYRALLEISGSRELRRLFPVIHMPIVYAQHPVPGLQKIRVRDYRSIARAVQAGDEVAADEAGMDHVRSVRREIAAAPSAA